MTIGSKSTYHPTSQSFARTLIKWIPYYRTVTEAWDTPDGTYPPRSECVSAGIDEFSRLSSFSPFFSPAFPIAPDESDMLTLKIWQRAMPIHQTGDFYALTETSKSSDSFLVNQLFRPEKSVGYLQCVRNVLCRKNTVTVFPRSLDPKKQYIFENM